MKVRIKFSKEGPVKFIGHLDTMRYFQKAIRRANLPVAFSGGYSPHMIMSFAQPLGVGITSDGEYLDIELKEPIDSKEAVRRMNQVMVEGIEIVSFRQIPDDKKYSGMTIVDAADYKVTLLESFKSSDVMLPVPQDWSEKVDSFMSQPQIVVWKKTKRSEKEVDIKPMIYKMQVSEDNIYLLLATGSEQNLKPNLVMEAFLSYIGENPEEVPLHFHRLEVYAENSDTSSEEAFVSLESLGTDIILGVESYE